MRPTNPMQSDAPQPERIPFRLTQTAIDSHDREPLTVDDTVTQRHTGLLTDVPRAWPTGKPEEAVRVIREATVALLRLLSWVIAGLGRLLLWVIGLIAKALAWISRKVSQDRLRMQASLVIGWLITLLLILATLSTLGISRGWFTRWLPTSHNSNSLRNSSVHITSSPVAYIPPPASCTTPRLACGTLSETVDGYPTMSAAQILTVLQTYHSPTATADFANALYDLGIRYGMNPAYALGFFVEESQCGTQGLAVHTQSLGNIRFTQSNSPVGYGEYQGFRSYSSWRDGAEDWYWVLKTYYLSQGVRDINDITPIYAPSNDNNDPHNYAQTVYGLVAQWSK